MPFWNLGTAQWPHTGLEDESRSQEKAWWHVQSDQQQAQEPQYLQSDQLSFSD